LGGKVELQNLNANAKCNIENCNFEFKIKFERIKIKDLSKSLKSWKEIKSQLFLIQIDTIEHNISSTIYGI
jgi:hypothetical protein